MNYISIILTLIIIAIAIHNTHGRISRNRYLKIELYIISSLIIYWVFALIMHVIFHIYFFLVIGIIGIFIFNYFNIKLQILRLHDLNYSGWYHLFSYVPFISLYFLYIKLAHKRKFILNEFEESIDYFDFLKKNKLYPKVSYMEKNGVNWIINEVNFEYKKYNGKTQYEVSKISLEEDNMLHEYCKKNLIQTENAPSYAEKYKISFLGDDELFEKIRNDLNAIFVDEGFIKVNGVKVFVRKDYGLYEIVYKKNYSDKIKSYSKVEEINEYCCQTLNKEQLIEFINVIS